MLKVAIDPDQAVFLARDGHGNAEDSRLYAQTGGWRSANTVVDGQPGRPPVVAEFARLNMCAAPPLRGATKNPRQAPRRLCRTGRLPCNPARLASLPAPAVSLSGPAPPVPEPPLPPRPHRSKPAAGSLDELLVRLRRRCSTYSINLSEFFSDFDRRRCFPIRPCPANRNGSKQLGVARAPPLTQRIRSPPRGAVTPHPFPSLPLAGAGLSRSRSSGRRCTARSASRTSRPTYPPSRLPRWSTPSPPVPPMAATASTTAVS